MKTRSGKGKKVVVRIPTENTIKKMKKDEKIMKKTKETLKKANQTLKLNMNKISKNVESMNKIIKNNNKLIKNFNNELKKMGPITSPLASPVKILPKTPNRKYNNIMMKNL